MELFRPTLRIVPAFGEEDLLEVVEVASAFVFVVALVALVAALAAEVVVVLVAVVVACTVESTSPCIVLVLR